MKVFKKMVCCAVCAAVLLAGCGKKAAEPETEAVLQDAYRTTYEIFVYSFADGNGDGIGDLGGIRKKLDYINDGKPGGEDLGCTAVWMTPVFPSPTYHKYDVMDYTAIDPQFGTMEDFEALLADLHSRGMWWIMDLPVNHTSTQHPWFREAVSYLTGLGPEQEPVYEECPYVWYYHFSEEPYEGYVPLSESGVADDPAGRWFYEARFWSGMPDLNLDTEAVKEELTKILQFWIDKGVDGFRLDAVTSYYTANAEANIHFLNWFSDTAKKMKPDLYLVAEAWENQNVYAEYYRGGIDSLFDFAYAGAEGQIAQTVRGKRSAAVFGESLEQEEALYGGINAGFVNAPFYTNHDMARSAGYYSADDGSKVKLAGALNLLMTGNAFIYYGEELGMKGSGNKDENFRAPMYWSDSDTEETCDGPSGMDAVSMKYPSMEEQNKDPLSVLSYYREAVALRKAFPVIARGKTDVQEELSGDTVLAMTRTMDDGSYAPVLIVINTDKAPAEIQLGGAAEFGTLAASLHTHEDDAQLADGVLTLPGYGVTVLTGGEDADAASQTGK